MVILTLEDIKRHVRLDGDVEDDELLDYGESAEEQLWQDLGKTYDEVLAEYGSVPVSLRHAALMLVAHYYKHRGMGENVPYYDMPYTYDVKIKPYMAL